MLIVRFGTRCTLSFQHTKQAVEKWYEMAVNCIALDETSTVISVPSKCVPMQFCIWMVEIGSFHSHPIIITTMLLCGQLFVLSRDFSFVRPLLYLSNWFKRTTFKFSRLEFVIQSTSFPILNKKYRFLTNFLRVKKISDAAKRGWQSPLCLSIRARQLTPDSFAHS